MTTLTPTRATGATTKASHALLAEPPYAVDDEALGAPFEGTGVNGAFVADLLSAALTHERCGTHLYRSVAGRTANPVLRARYEEFGRETERHVELLEDAIAAIGGDPQYVSPIARAVQGMDTSLLESTFRLDGTADVMVREMVMLDAVLLAETTDHANWANLAQLRGPARRRGPRGAQQGRARGGAPGGRAPPLGERHEGEDDPPAGQQPDDGEGRGEGRGDGGHRQGVVQLTGFG